LYRRSLATVLLLVAGWCAAAEPPHLSLARDVVANVKPEDNEYTNSRRYLRTPLDLFSSSYTVHTDCTGFVEEVLHRSSGFAPKFSTRKFPDRYSIIDYVDGINRGESFSKLTRIQDLQPGDFIAWKYVAGTAASGINGHIAMVATTPTPTGANAQNLKEAQQWEVTVIDSSTGPASPDDTRYVQGTSADQASSALTSTSQARMKLTGVGSGRFFIYTNEAGEVVGMAYGFRRAKINMQHTDWEIVMARAPLH